MELLVLPSRGAASRGAATRPLHHTTPRRVAGATTVRPAAAGATGSAVLFAVGLLGFHYGFLSSRWDTAERGSLLGWELAARHWNELSMAKHPRSSMDDEESDVDEEEEDDEEDDEDSD
uniref:Uncharacterized protein n=1 Tax=Oryza brachyantha TaxID=4533 RepID=J3LHJ6_ORYBR